MRGEGWEVDKRACRVYYDQVTVRQHIITFMSLKTRASFGYGVCHFSRLSILKFRLINPS